MLSELDEVWNKLNQGPHTSRLLLAETTDYSRKILTQSNRDDECIWRCAARTSSHWNMAVPRFCDISKASGFLPGTSVCVLRRLVNMCLISVWSLYWGWTGGTKRESLRAPIVVRARKYPFRECLIPGTSGNVDTQLPLLAENLSLGDLLQPGGSYELVERLWERFVLTVTLVNVTVAWSQNEVLVMAESFLEPWVHSLSHFWSFVCFSQSSSTECFPVFWFVSLNG